MRLLFFIFITISSPSLSADQTHIKKNDNKEVTVAIRNLDKKADLIYETLKEEKNKKDFLNLLTLLTALVAVLISGLSAYLNYRVFRGQSISAFRKSWSNSIIESVSEFMVISSTLFTTLKKGILPSSYDPDILRLNAIYIATSFKIQESGFKELDIQSVMSEIISLIEETKKNNSFFQNDQFILMQRDLENKTTQIIKRNWDHIIKFK